MGTDRIDSTSTLPRSVERALLILDHVVTAGPAQLTEVARVVDLSTSTALRHLQGLEDSGYLERTPGGSYVSGPKIVRLAMAALDGAPVARLAKLAEPHLAGLVAGTGETSYLAVAEDQDQAVYVGMCESQQALRHVSWLGANIPRRGTAVGAALSGSVPAGDTAYQAGAVEPDVAAIASPVYGPQNTVVACLSVVGPSSRLEGERMSHASARVAEAAERLTGELIGIRLDQSA